MQWLPPYHITTRTRARTGERILRQQIELAKVIGPTLDHSALSYLAHFFSAQLSFFSTQKRRIFFFFLFGFQAKHSSGKLRAIIILLLSKDKLSSSILSESLFSRPGAIAQFVGALHFNGTLPPPPSGGLSDSRMAGIMSQIIWIRLQ